MVTWRVRFTHSDILCLDKTDYTAPCHILICESQIIKYILFHNDCILGWVTLLIQRHKPHLVGLHPHKGIGLLEVVADLAVQNGFFDIFLENADLAARA